MNLLRAVLVLLTAFGTHSSAYKILGLFVHNGKSHFDVFRHLLVALAEKGHEVTVVSHFPEKNPPKTYKDLSLAGSGGVLVNVIDITKL